MVGRWHPLNPEATIILFNLINWNLLYECSWRHHLLIYKNSAVHLTGCHIPWVGQKADYSSFIWIYLTKTFAQRSRRHLQFLCRGFSLSLLQSLTASQEKCRFCFRLSCVCNIVFYVHRSNNCPSTVDVRHFLQNLSQHNDQMPVNLSTVCCQTKVN